MGLARHNIFTLIFHRYFNEKASETVKSFPPKSGKRSGPGLAEINELRATNFKMDRDLSKFNQFNTSHGLEFQPYHVGPHSRAVPNADPMKSYVPQGDKEKAPNPVTDYRGNFMGHDVLSNKTIKAPNMHQGKVIDNVIFRVSRSGYLI